MKNLFQIIILIFVISFFSYSTAESQINASFTPSRTSGVAPLAVFFDATTTSTSTGLNTFHDLCYSWDFGDANATTWTHSGKSQNLDNGPVAGHLFKTPGTYSITLVVKDNIGNTDTQNISITVNDPDIVFTNSTTFFSITNNFSGVPTGAITSASTNFQDVVDVVNAGQRALLRRGETWIINGTNFTIGDTNIGYLGAWGASTSPDPMLTFTATTGDIFVFGNTSNVIIRDLDLQGNGTQAFGSGYQKLLSDITFYKVKMDNFHTGISLSPFHLLSGDPIFPRTSIIECSVTNAQGPASGGYGIFLAAEELLCMGNVINDISQSEHCLRITSLVKGVISHNYIEKPGAVKHHIKLHSGSFNGNEDIATRNRFTEFFIIANNKIVGSDNDWSVTLGPQSSSADERVRDGIVEKNFFIKGANDFQIPMVVNAQDITIRNNLFQMNLGTASSATAVSIFKRGVEPAPNNIALYNNTVIRTDNVGTLQLIDQDAFSTNIIHNNNLVYGPAATTVRINANNITGATEYASSTNPGFASTNFNISTSFQLNSASTLIEGGSTVPVCDDFFDNIRTNPYDIGAHEFSNTGGGVTCQTNLYISNNIPTNIYQVGQIITSDGTVLNGSDVNFKAGTFIDLLPGFEVINGALFLAEMDPCTP